VDVEEPGLTASLGATRTESPEPQAEAGALDRLTALVADDLAAVNALILDRMKSSVDLIPQLAGYLIASGGKRIRPVLTLASARLCGHEGQRHIGLAAAVEFIHTATLLHDDVVDESDLRRGQASANVVFGNQASVLVGDFLFSRAFQVMVEDGSMGTLGILANASAVIAEGEVLQLSAAHDTVTSRDTYLRIISAKTAELFAAACEIGAVVADRSPAECEAMRRFGTELGIAFQIVDDVLDYSAAQARLGKTIGDDFREGKITLPVILAMERGTEEEREFWRRTLEENQQAEPDLDHAVVLLQRRNALVDSMTTARTHAEAARQALALLPASPMRKALEDVVDFVVERDF
jgi:octaprenyl-diphosphate synthase